MVIALYESGVHMQEEDKGIKTLGSGFNFNSMPLREPRISIDKLLS